MISGFFESCKVAEAQSFVSRRFKKDLSRFEMIYSSSSINAKSAQSAQEILSNKFMTSCFFESCRGAKVLFRADLKIFKQINYKKNKSALICQNLREKIYETKKPFR